MCKNVVNLLYSTVNDSFFIIITEKTTSKTKDSIKLIAMTAETDICFTIKLNMHSSKTLPIRLTVDLNEIKEEIFSTETILLN